MCVDLFGRVLEFLTGGLLYVSADPHSQCQDRVRIHDDLGLIVLSEFRRLGLGGMGQRKRIVEAQDERIRVSIYACASFVCGRMFFGLC